MPPDPSQDASDKGLPDESLPDESLADKSLPGPARARRRLLAAGVGSACILGAGLGLWARPSDLERPPAPVAMKIPVRPPPPSAPRQIAILVAGAVRRPEPPKPVQAVVAAAPLAPRATPPAGLSKAVAPRVEPAPLKAVAPAAPAARPPQAPPEVRVTRASAPARKPPKAVRLAVAQQPARPRRPAKTAPVRLAKAQPAAHGLARTVRPSPRLALAHAHRAQPDRRPLLAVHAAPPVAHLQHIRAVAPPARTVSAHAANLPRCASRDPAAALVCGDPALTAADRRLERAYREAQAAGVPAWRLESQQQRWLAARATAARQAPWAVHDVYVARIAELQDEIRQAQDHD